MKTKTLFIFCVLFTSIASSSFATPESDGQIMDMANSSFDVKGIQRHVTVSVFNGMVTLTGTARNQAYKDVAGEYVRSLPGVTEVTNKLVIDPSVPEPVVPERTDNWIAVKIHLQLAVRAGVSVVNTKVEVKNGYVTLTGTASSVAQKELTSEYVQDVLGVKVTTNNMVVKGAVAGTPEAVQTPVVIETVDDASLSAYVQYILLNSASAYELKPTIITQNGVVTITGEATSEAQKTAVTKITQSVRGVKSVSNKMTVAPVPAATAIRPAPAPIKN